MKKKIVLLWFLLATLSLDAQQKQTNQVSFEVSDVETTKSDLKETSYKHAIEQRVNRLIEGYPTENEDIKIVPTGFNAFVASIHFAYADHRPLIISPDMIWLLICQGFSIHVNKNYKELQSKIVTHQGKKEILITKNNFKKGKNNPWEEVFETFSDSIKKYFKGDLYNLVVADFSTTGIPEKAAYQITLMEASKKYFEAVMETGCGIPSITLEGKTSDWEWIRSNIKNFRKYNLEIWIDNLIPILDQFVAASKGKIDTDFWQSIYKVSHHYIPIYSTGWILKFFPYYQKWKHVHNKKKKTSYKYTDYIPNPYIEGEKYRLSTLTTKDFPNGVSKFPFIWKYTADSIPQKYHMEIYAGFIGLRQNKETKSVRAEISWAIRDKKSSWLSSTRKGTYVKKRKPYEFFKTRVEEKPERKPIFAPNECKTYYEGLKKLDEFIEKKVIELKNNEKLTGKVTIQFVVTWAGTIADIKVLKSTERKEENLAKKIIANLPKWKPGTKKDSLGMDANDYAVSVLQKITINFDLNKN